MSLNHDSEIKINVCSVHAFSAHVEENYNLSELDYSPNMETGDVTIKYNLKMHYFLIDSIKHAAMSWNAAVLYVLQITNDLAKEELKSTIARV